MRNFHGVGIIPTVPAYYYIHVLGRYLEVFGGIMSSFYLSYISLNILQQRRLGISHPREIWIVKARQIRGYRVAHLLLFKEPDSSHQVINLDVMRAVDATGASAGKPIGR